MKSNTFVTTILNFRSSKWYGVIIILYFLCTGISVFASIGIWDKWHLYTNISESMSPTIQKADLVIVSKKDQHTYDVGDIVSFYAEFNGQEEVITHRIHKIGGNVYITKGDNNTVPDKQYLRPRMIIGEVVSIVPYVGYAVIALKSIIGRILFILVPMIFIITVESLSISRSRVNKNKPVVQ